MLFLSFVICHVGKGNARGYTAGSRLHQKKQLENSWRKKQKSGFTLGAELLERELKNSARHNPDAS